MTPNVREGMLGHEDGVAGGEVFFRELVAVLFVQDLSFLGGVYMQN